MIRVIRIVVLIYLSFWIAGCTSPEEEPAWKNVKIPDLNSQNVDNTQNMRLLKTINLDLRIFEIPADNIREIDDIRRALEIRPLRFNNHLAFSANSFSAYYGKGQTWITVHDLLLAAGAQEIMRSALLLPDGEEENITIIELEQPQIVFFTSSSGLKEGANIGPGILALRINVEKSPESNDSCNITAYPIFTLMKGNTIPELDVRLKARDFPFTAAAFGLNMRPGDFVFLAPERYISDQSTLCGLFFSNPQGNLFFSKTERKPPERKQAVRILLLTCVGINY